MIYVKFFLLDDIPTLVIWIGITMAACFIGLAGVIMLHYFTRSREFEIHGEILDLSDDKVPIPSSSSEYMITNSYVHEYLLKLRTGFRKVISVNLEKDLYETIKKMRGTVKKIHLLCEERIWDGEITGKELLA